MAVLRTEPLIYVNYLYCSSPTNAFAVKIEYEKVVKDYGRVLLLFEY